MILSTNKTMSQLVEHLKEYIHSTKTELQIRDVLEINEYVLRTFLEQKSIHQKIDTSLPTAEIKQDNDGDYVDKDGFIYDIQTQCRIGEKKGTEKIIYKII